MKTSRKIFSNTGIIATIATLLISALVLFFVGIDMALQDHINGVAVVAVRESDSVMMYVIAGVMGDIPSVAGTLQSYALALAYGLTPIVALLMFTAKNFVASSSSDEQKAFA